MALHLVRKGIEVVMAEKSRMVQIIEQGCGFKYEYVSSKVWLSVALSSL